MESSDSEEREGDPVQWGSQGPGLVVPMGQNKFKGE